MEMIEMKSAVFVGQTAEELADDMIAKSQMFTREQMDDIVLLAAKTSGFLPADLATFGVISKYAGKPKPDRTTLVQDIENAFARVKSLGAEQVKRSLKAMSIGAIHASKI